jgi:hypothetical protein
MMIRFYLPIEGMGITKGVDPNTYEPDMYHPILDVGSSYSSVKTEIMQWLAEYYGDDPEQRTGIDHEYYIDFDTEADLTWFKLRWLS